MNITKETKILCVCTHNYFRSQIMEWLLRARGYKNVRSAGCLSAYLGERAFPDVMAAINRRGGECFGYAAHQLDIEDILWADSIFCAEVDHVLHITNIVKRQGTGLSNTSIYCLNVPDGGVTNPEAVDRAANIIVERFDAWNL